MSAKLTCPQCQAPIKLKQPAESGKKLRCPKCGASFNAPRDDAGDEPTNEHEAEEKTSKKKRGSKKKAKAGGNTLLFVGVGAALVVLLLVCGGGGAGIWYFTTKPTEKTAQATDKGPGATADKPTPKLKPPSHTDEAFLNDPKWKSGNEARALIVGTWYYAQSTHLYEFHADGKMWDKSPQVAGKPGAQFPFTYRITDPQKLSLAGQEYRLLICQDEMYMVTKSSAIGPYRRK